MDNPPSRREAADETPKMQQQQENPKQPFTQTSLFWVLTGVAIVVVVVGLWLLLKTSADSRRQAEEALKAKEEAELALEQQALQFEYESLNR